MRWILAIVLALAPGATLSAAQDAQLFFSRTFRGLTPEYVQVTVERDGSAVYRESVDDPDDQPIEFRLRPNEVDAMFALAEKANYLRDPLESHAKVANMGLKTIRWRLGDESHEQAFNHTENAAATELAGWFARIVDNVQHLIYLERSAQFDKLGVNKVLLQIQVLVERKQMVAGEMYLPLLDRVAKNETYLDMARARAANLAKYIRTGELPTE